MRLNDYLKSKGVTQTQFGLSLNPPMTQMRISHLITGRTRISLRRSVEIVPADGKRFARLQSQPARMALCAGVFTGKSSVDEVVAAIVAAVGA